MPAKATRSRRYIRDLQPGERIEDEVFLIASKDLRTTSNGSLYIHVILADKTGQVPARIWQATESQYQQMPEGGFLRFKARTESYKGSLQVIIEGMRAVDPDGVNLYRLRAREPARESSAGGESAGGYPVMQVHVHPARRPQRQPGVRLHLGQQRVGHPAPVRRRSEQLLRQAISRAFQQVIDSLAGGESAQYKADEVAEVFAKIEKNKKEYHLELINLSNVVQSAVDAMTYWLKEQGFKTEVKIESDIKTRADGDAIEQAVLNLLSNAMKYSFKQKEIKLDLFARNQSIYIQVGDKGIGIPDKEQKHIFDKYYRVPMNHEGDKGGAGLGLTVVKHIIDAHRGTIKIKSRVNRGSTFTMILPQNLNESEDRFMG